MPIIVEGNQIADEILKGLKSRVADLKIKPKLVVFLVGQDPVSLSYIKIKGKKAEEVGIEVEVQNFPENISQNELELVIQKLNSDLHISGILVQLPLPESLDRQAILDAVLPELDVDCLTSINKQRLIKGDALFVPPTASAVLKIFDRYRVELPKKNILIVGTGDLIGKPLAVMFLNQGLSFEMANRYTENLSDLARKADVIITGTGKPGLITGEMIKPGAIVIDAGTTGSEGGDVVGDVGMKTVLDKVSLIAAVPGGVGPVTVAMLLQNVVKAAQNRVRS